MCRTANGYDINGFGQLKDGRGNICPVTIILPTIAMEAKEYIEKEYAIDLKYNPFAVTDEYYIDKFMEMLDEMIHDAKDMLIERFDYICSKCSEAWNVSARSVRFGRVFGNFNWRKSYNRKRYGIS